MHANQTLPRLGNAAADARDIGEALKQTGFEVTLSYHRSNQMTVGAPRVGFAVSSAPVIALVDNDHDVRNGLQFLLEAHGFTAIPYASGVEFLAELPHISLLIVEQDLPGLNGLQVVRQFRKVAGRSVPILLFSAKLNSDTEARALDLGVMRVIAKPEVLDLIQTVHTALSGACA